MSKCDYVFLLLYMYDFVYFSALLCVLISCIFMCICHIY